MSIDIKEIGETLNMVAQQNLDVRTITMGINTMCCADEDIDVMARKVYNRMTTAADRLVSVAEALEREYGIPIVNKRISVTPMAMIAAATKARDLTPLAKAEADLVGNTDIANWSAQVKAEMQRYTSEYSGYLAKLGYQSSEKVAMATANTSLSNSLLSSMTSLMNNPEIEFGQGVMDKLSSIFNNAMINNNTILEMGFTY